MVIKFQFPIRYCSMKYFFMFGSLKESSVTAVDG